MSLTNKEQGAFSSYKHIKDFDNRSSMVKIVHVSSCPGQYQGRVLPSRHVFLNADENAPE